MCSSSCNNVVYVTTIFKVDIMIIYVKNEDWNIIFACNKGRVTYKFSDAMRQNDANNMTHPPPPTICVISRFSTKSIVF